MKAGRRQTQTRWLMLTLLLGLAVNATLAALDEDDWEFPDEDDDGEAAPVEADNSDDANVLDVDINEQMWQAAFMDNLADLEAALAAGADPNDVDPNSRYTILQTAIYRGQVGRWVGPSNAQYKSTGTETARALLQAGADPNLRKDKPLGGTALMYAAEWQKLNVIELLLEHGADPNIQSNPSKDAQKKRGKKKKKKKAAWEPSEAPPQTYGGNTALHAASFVGNKAIVQALLQAGANPSLTSDGGLTPLDMARQKGHSENLLEILAVENEEL